MHTDPDNLLMAIREQLAAGAGDAAAMSAALERVLAAFDCPVGSLHRLNAATGLLDLVAARGVPEAIMPQVRHIPVGKGMAGLAAQRREPVQTCNLQTDESGVAKPGAKLTRMQGSVAAPIIVDGELRGTIGVAKPQAYEFSREENELLMRIGQVIAERWTRG